MVTLSEIRVDQSYAHAQLGTDLVFQVNPATIKKLIKKECRVGSDWLQQKPFFDYFVIGGDWDRDYSWVAEDRNYIEMGELLACRENFRSSDAYSRCVAELLEGHPQKGKDGTPFESVGEIDEAFRHYLALITSMETRGYLPTLDTTKAEGERHIGVAIARDGELFHFRTGHHRLAIARQLGLSSALVQVHCVHSEWANKAVRERGGDELQAIRQAIGTLAKEQEIGRD
jgi:hypothetical protein